MGVLLDMALSFLGDLLWGVFERVATFFLQFFPDADQGIVSAIHGWGSAMSGADLTFNVFYFVDIRMVSVFFSMTVVVLLAMLVIGMVKSVLALVHKLIEAIPVIE